MATNERSLRGGALARVLVVTTAAAGLVLVMTTLTGTLVAPGTAEPSPLEGIPAGWTELPEAPEAGAGAAYVWTGSEVLAWGGCASTNESRCAFAATGFSFDPVARTWEPMPPTPSDKTDADTVTHGDAAWTGREAIFLTEVAGRVGGKAFDPESQTWRAIPLAPIAYETGGVRVWTGTELIVWGGGANDSATTRDGAAYNPRTDSWRPLPEAPLGLNLASGVWTGEEMIVFGSLLDDRNWADSNTSVGAAYDPISDAWRRLPPSDLSPQATSATWSHGRLLAWDYDVRSQAYDPETDSWSPATEMPLEFSECYPDSAVIAAKTFAFFCGQAALHDDGSWREVRGGPLDEKINGLDLWRFATLVPAGDVVFMPLEGITVGLTSEGEPCYGCPGSPTSFWAYRP
jgi:hypothetical protein